MVKKNTQCGIKSMAQSAWRIEQGAEDREQRAESVAILDCGLRPSETGFAFHGAGIADFKKIKDRRDLG